MRRVFIYLFLSAWGAEELNARRSRGSPERRLLVCIHHSGLKQMARDCGTSLFCFLPRTSPSSRMFPFGKEVMDPTQPAKNIFKHQVALFFSLLN